MKNLVLFVVVMLCGCTQMLPATSKLEAPGVYTVKAFGNSFANIDKLKEKVDKKAAKLCGESGFTYVDGGLQVKQERTYNNGGTQSGSYKVFSKTVKCGEG